MHLLCHRFFLSLCLLVPIFFVSACNSGSGSDSSAMGSDAALLMALTQGSPAQALPWSVHVDHIGSAWVSDDNDGNLVLADVDRATFAVDLRGQLAPPYSYAWEVYPKTGQGSSPSSQILSPSASQTVIGFPFTGTYAYTLTATDVHGRSASVLFRVNLQGHAEPHVIVGRVVNSTSGTPVSLPNQVQIRFALYDAGQGIWDELVIRETSSDFDGEFYVEGLVSVRGNYRVVLPSGYELDTTYFGDFGGDRADWVPDLPADPRWGFIPWVEWQAYLLLNDG